MRPPRRKSGFDPHSRLAQRAAFATQQLHPQCVRPQLRRDTLRPVVLKLREDRMKRREFIAATAALLVRPRPLLAGGPPRRVGYLDSAFKYLPLFKVWQDSLRDHGWIEGKNLIVDYRSAEGRAERLSALAAEVVTLKPDLLVGPGPQVALALKSANPAGSRCSSRSRCCRHRSSARSQRTPGARSGAASGKPVSSPDPPNASLGSRNLSPEPPIVNVTPTSARRRRDAGTLSRLGQFRLDHAPCTKLKLEAPRP